MTSGKIVCPTIGQTRTEADFADHIERTVHTDPTAPWVFVADQLCTHMSATLVELVARLCGIDEDLGVKYKHGILKSK